MRRLINLAAFAWLLNGCATAPLPQEPAPPLSERRTMLQAIDTWELDGKVAVRQQGDYHSASLSWRQYPDRYRIFLAGPLGQGAVDIEGAPGAVTLRTGGEVYRAASPEVILYQQLGWTLPVSELHYWVRGLAAPDWPAEREFDQRHRLTSLKQRGWHIRYTGYHDGQPLDLPRKLLLSRGPDLRVTLLIKIWNLPPESLPGV